MSHSESPGRLSYTHCVLIPITWANNGPWKGLVISGPASRCQYFFEHYKGQAILCHMINYIWRMGSGFFNIFTFLEESSQANIISGVRDPKEILFMEGVPETHWSVSLISEPHGPVRDSYQLQKNGIWSWPLTYTHAYSTLTCTYTIHSHTHTHTHIFMYHIHIHVYTYTHHKHTNHKNIHVLTYTHMYTHTHIHMYTHLHTYACIMYTNRAHTYTWTYTYIHTHASLKGRTIWSESSVHRTHTGGFWVFRITWGEIFVFPKGCFLFLKWYSTC